MEEQQERKKKWGEMKLTKKKDEDTSSTLQSLLLLLSDLSLKLTLSSYPLSSPSVSQNFGEETVLEGGELPQWF